MIIQTTYVSHAFGQMFYIIGNTFLKIRSGNLLHYVMFYFGVRIKLSDSVPVERENSQSLHK